MGTLDGRVPTVGPLTVAQLTDEINTELAELYKRSFVKVTGVSGTNSYTGSIPLSRALEDQNGFIMVVPNTSTGPCFFNGKPLRDSTGAVLQEGQLQADQVIAFIYHLTADQYRIVTPMAGGAAPIVRVYTAASSTWVKPAGLRYVRVRIQAAGGNGGSDRYNGSTSTNYGGGGGGSGGYGEKIIGAVSLASSVTLSISAPGSVGSSSFGTLLVQNTGSNGNNAGNNNVGSGGAGGGGSGADLQLLGSSGGAGTSGVGYGYAGGVGGRGFLAPYGVGGGGAGSFSSGTGSPGIIIVEEYY